MLVKAWIKYSNMIMKILMGIAGHPHDWVQCWVSITHSPRSPKITFPEVFHIKFFAFNIKWTECSLYELIDIDVNSKAAQLFDFIKLNIIQKLAYKVKYISQI